MNTKSNRMVKLYTNEVHLSHSPKLIYNTPPKWWKKTTCLKLRKDTNLETNPNLKGLIGQTCDSQLVTKSFNQFLTNHPFCNKYNSFSCLFFTGYKVIKHHKEKEDKINLAKYHNYFFVFSLSFTCMPQESLA